MKKQTLRQKLAIAEEEERKARRELTAAKNKIGDLKSQLERVQGDLDRFVRVTARAPLNMPRDVFEVTLRVSRHDLAMMADPDDYARHLSNVMLAEIGRILRNPPR